MADKTFFQLLTEFKDYRPQDRHHTSAEEVDKIERHFGLQELDVLSLRNLRDMTVLFFESRFHNSRQKDFDWTGMYSITAVIDQQIYSKATDADNIL